MHKSQIEFIKKIKEKYPKCFANRNVLDVGSVDINGNNRQFFTDCNYTGIDIIVGGKNVDIACPIHKYESNILYDTIICTEMLEHDIFWQESVKRMIDLLAIGGLLIVTAAGVNRKEHGTRTNQPDDSPSTLDYYKNINFYDLHILVVDYCREREIFFEITENKDKTDIYMILQKFENVNHC